ncbi:MAG TPA: protein-L-isoaspartate(D-aspartate) O-methyltransferase [Parasulfuritortus sp.]
MSPADDDKAREAARLGLKAMLLDIEYEVEATRRQIGKDAFDPRVMAAMGRVPREQFVPDLDRLFAFRNGPVSIGYGQTISQPYIVALMTDLLNPKPDSVVLEVGTGSGYQAAVLAELVRQVYSVEIVKPLADAARGRLARLGYANVDVRHADGYHGWREHAPYDGIVVTAAAPHVPQPLVDQLKPGARLVIPVGEPHGFQLLEVLDKRADGGCDRRTVLAVAFVPLTRETD